MRNSAKENNAEYGKKLGQLLYTKRRGLRRSREYVARKTGMAASTVSNIEKGVSANPSVFYIKAIADCYKLNFDALIIEAMMVGE